MAAAANTEAVNGRLLSSYASNYRLAAVCYRYTGMTDTFDVQDLYKSSLYEITNVDRIMIIIPIDERFNKTPALGTSYVLLAVPKTVNMDQFSTLRQASAMGVIQLGGKAKSP